MTNWTWLAVAVLAFSGGRLLGEWRGERLEALRWQAKTAQTVATAESTARASESMWQEVVNGTVRNYEKKLANVRSVHARDLGWVRLWPERSERSASGGIGLSPSAGVASAGIQGCAGDELSREDAEFLVGEAARAEELRAGIEACYTVLEGGR